MIDEKEYFSEAIKDRHDSILDAKQTRFKRNKNKKRVFWAEDLTEICGEGSPVSKIVSPIILSSEQSSKKLKGILKMPRIGKRAKLHQ